jgi:hypothetical protein
MPGNAIRAVRRGVSIAARGVPGAALAVLGRFGVGRRRRVMIIVVCAGLAVLFLGFGALAQFPITVADTAAAWIFGGRVRQAGAPQIPDICVTPPSPTATQAQLVSPPDGPSVVPAPLPAGLGPDGRPTEQARNVLAHIPAGADVAVAQGWILYGLAHPRDAGMDFTGFVTMFDQASDRLSRQATALDVVSTLDPRADYSPYLLLAQVGSYQLMRQGSAAANDLQRDELVDAINVTCQGHSN